MSSPVTLVGEVCIALQYLNDFCAFSVPYNFVSKKLLRTYTILFSSASALLVLL